MVLALWTGQRQGDLLKFRWSDYQDGKIRVFQSKGQKRVTIPVGDTLADALKGAPKRAVTILTGQRGDPGRATGSGPSGAKHVSELGLMT